MAFVFKAEKKDPDTVQANLPGPGQYLGQDAYAFSENRIGFHSSTSKEQAKPNQDPELGPGSYNIARDLLAVDKTQNVFFMPADPDKEVEQVKATNVFKSKTKRFEHNVDTEGPGPGSYNQALNSGKKPNYPKPSSKLKVVQDMLQQGKTMIPSIPSNTHSYGYTENDEHDLVLNQDPLAQAQQYVGPGYYEVKENPQGAKYKGPSWHKSGVKKLDSFAKSTATSHIVGPGTYEAPEPTLPAFKSKPNAGFVSTSTRSFDAHVKQKLGFSKAYGKTPLSSQSEVDGRRLSAAETDIESEDDEYLKEATPGPGYYYNESMLSSFSAKNSDFSSTGGLRGSAKPKTHGFGRTQRFKEQYPTTKEIGPGDYDVKSKSNKFGARAKVPFQSSNTRFERALVPLQPGPGTYNPPLTLVDRVQDKAKSGYVGSFGITEKRFKISKLLEETPGPGMYIQDNQKSYVEDITAAFRKGSHYFTSSSQRVPFNGKNDINAAPGSYNLNHFNIATKVAKQEDDLGLPRNEPFSFGPDRFPKPKEKVIPEDDEEDEDDEPRFGAARNFDSLFKPKMKPKPNAVFSSSTKRTIPGEKKVLIPGPGSYHDSNQNMWNKRTFNIHFTGD